MPVPCRLTLFLCPMECCRCRHRVDVDFCSTLVFFPLSFDHVDVVLLMCYDRAMDVLWTNYGCAMDVLWMCYDRAMDVL